LLNIGFIAFNLKEYIDALSKPLTILNALILGLLSIHVRWICKGFKLGIKSISYSVSVVLLLALFKLVFSGDFSPLTLSGTCNIFGPVNFLLFQ
jgi:hypothetical protein